MENSLINHVLEYIEKFIEKIYEFCQKLAIVHWTKYIFALKKSIGILLILMVIFNLWSLIQVILFDEIICLLIVPSSDVGRCWPMRFLVYRCETDRFYYWDLKRHSDYSSPKRWIEYELDFPSRKWYFSRSKKSYLHTYILKATWVLSSDA